MRMTFVYAIAFSGEKFLMARNKDRGWEMPGGEVEPGESPEDAMIREFLEETGMGFRSFSCTDIPNGKVFFGVVEVDSRGSQPCACGCCRTIDDSQEAIAEVSFFDKLPEGLSFPRKEYETMLQEGRIALKKYINRNSIGDECAT